MSTEVDDPPEQTAASLVSGILGDLQNLVEQQFQLTRREIEEELRQRAIAISVLALGMGVLFLDAILLCFTVVHWLHWMTLPAEFDPARFPLWACHALVAAVLFLFGGIVAWIGRARFAAIESSRNPVTEILREHVPWTTHPK